MQSKDLCGLSFKFLIIFVVCLDNKSYFCGKQDLNPLKQTTMKKIILITLFTLLGLTQAVAQEYEYVPFVREGVKWECSCFNFLSDLFPYGVSYYTLEMKGDTVIDGKHYKPVHLYSGESINEENDTVPVYLREEDKVVYAYIPDGRRYVECPVGIGQTICGYDIDWAWSTGEEHILYDFNDMAGFYDYLEETSGGWVWGQVYQGSDMVMVSDRMVKRYKFRSDSEFNKYTQYIIEGLGYIGIDGMPLSYFQWETTGMQNGYHLERVIEDGQVIYENGDFPFEYNYVPFVREGVKWVYYYYNGDDYYPADPNLASGMVYLNLEFKGDTVINGKTYKAMHKYYGEAINEENDTIPIYMREEGKVVYAIVPDCKFYLDCPIGNYEGSAEDFNAMEQGREFVLYDFSDPVAYWNQAFNQQDWLTGIDTITVGKHLAKRYTGEHWGRFYIIEGIGFDASSCYTLCFFMPMSTGYGDVYFGLSHVIEGGEIIYATDNYDPDHWTGINEVDAEKTQRSLDPRYYDLMGRALGTEVPTTPGIYIHQGKKIMVR